MPVGPRTKVIGWSDKKHTEPVNEEVRRMPGEKDTKRWCRGKVGREHDPKAKLLFPGGDWYVLVCRICGKQLKLFPSLEELNAEKEKRTKSESPETGNGNDPLPE